MAFRSTPQEDSRQASQSPAIEEACEMLGQVDQEAESLDQGPSPLRRRNTEDIEKQTLHHTEVANSLSPADSISISPSANGKTMQLWPGITAFGQESVTKTTYPIQISPKTPQASPFDKPKASPSPTAGGAGLQKSELDTTVAGEESSMNFDINADHAEHKLSCDEPRSSAQKADNPQNTCSAKSRQPMRHLDDLSPGGSPQIGTSLLKRESLRRRESPSRKREAQKVKSPKKRDTLSRRDTLQEREILQKVIAETSQDTHGKNVDTESHEAIVTSGSKPNVESQATAHIAKTTSSGLAANARQASEPVTLGVESNSQDANATDIGKDLHRAMETIEVLEQPLSSLSDEAGLENPTDQVEEIKAIDSANEFNAAAEVEEAARTAEAVREQSDIPLGKTRSGARFSDDTSMLRDFLNRAQASKAAKTPVLLPIDAPNNQVSPRRSPRKKHGSHKGITSTPQQLGDIANRQGTPPGTIKFNFLESDDAEEVTVTPTSCRRSTRTRLSAPSKPPPGAPSFIPVRRADGTDPVVLQKSQAQELAMTTRANTRRNKGQSKPPLLALKELPADTSKVMSVKQRADTGKAVGWAENIACYQEAKEKVDEGEETRPKVRRMRGLGTANGTPAPKKSAAVVSSNGTPAPKRRGKAMAAK